MRAWFSAGEPTAGQGDLTRPRASGTRCDIRGTSPACPQGRLDGEIARRRPGIVHKPTSFTALAPKYTGRNKTSPDSLLGHQSRWGTDTAEIQVSALTIYLALREKESRAIRLGVPAAGFVWRRGRGGKIRTIHRPSVRERRPDSRCDLTTVILRAMLAILMETRCCRRSAM
jgi:hypothetical protein